MLRYGLHWDERVKLVLQDRGLEWFSTAVMLWWSVCLALPGNTLDGPAFTAFHRYHWMTEEFWSCAFGIVGGMRFLALCINGHAKTKTPYWRMGGALFGVLTWSQVAALFWQAAHVTIGTGVGVYALLAIADLLSIFRASFDARYNHR